MPPSRFWPNPRVSPLPVPPPSASGRPAGASSGPRGLHRRLPGYAPTALVDLPAVASAVGVGRVVAKAEVERFGLPSFKVLGASWATYRLLAERLGGEPSWSTVGELAATVAAELGPLRLAAATDGNHGRAVAHMARLLGLDATILVPTGTVPARIEGIAGEGAEVVVVDGTYDDAVAGSASLASDTTLVVSDTSWPGYEDPPRWVIEGYSTIFAELAEQLPGLDLDGVAALDVAIVPLGVGALGAAAATALGPTSPPDAAARVATPHEGLPPGGVRAAGAGAGEVASHEGLPPGGVRATGAAPAGAGHRDAPGLWPGSPGGRPALVGVEPESAACVLAAVEAGEVVEVPGPHRSIMAGLNCGLASPLALPAVAAGFAGFLAVGDDRCRDAVRALAEAGLDVGETGAAALAGLTALVDDHSGAGLLGPDATVLLLATEGVTDPANFERIVGRPPRSHTP